MAPNLWMRVVTPTTNAPMASSADAAIIFGAIVRSGKISPLHAERLQTGIDLLELRKVEKLVVSNAPEASRVMKAYLIDQGVAEEQIEVDPTAIRTPDSCAFEAANGNRRSVLLISQKFHLPRIAQHCAPYDFPRGYVYADSPNRAPMPWHRIATIRAQRFLRECALSWSVLLKLYPED